MTTPVNFRPIYDRHQGPYVLLLLRESAKGLFTDRVTGSSLRAQAAHERAIDLINGRDPAKIDVHSVFVFSDTEGQFTGALYKRGEEYAAWEHLAIDDAPPTPAKPRRLEVRRVPADGVESPTTEAGVPTPAKPRPAKLPGDRFPVMRGRPLVHNPEGNWPKSAPAQFVKSFFGQQPPGYSATSAELVAAIGQSLTDLGVQFPASLISRLKQAGLLTEKKHGEETVQGEGVVGDEEVRGDDHDRGPAEGV